jgi:hypothetical protein
MTEEPQPQPDSAADVRAKLERAEELLREIRDGKHSLPGTLVQIDRYFEADPD